MKRNSEVPSPHRSNGDRPVTQAAVTNTQRLNVGCPGVADGQGAVAGFSRYSQQARGSACVWAALALSLAPLVGCGFGADGGSGVGGAEPRTSEAIRDAQDELYGALFQDPPDFETASSRMSSACRSSFADSEQTVAVLFEEVELAQSVDLSEDDLAGLFSQISYTIEDDTASGDDGSVWVYEDEAWLSEDC